MLERFNQVIRWHMYLEVIHVISFFYQGIIHFLAGGKVYFVYIALTTIIEPQLYSSVGPTKNRFYY